MRLTVGAHDVDRDVAAAAGAALRDGRLVAFPTETVYGLGADAWNAAAVRRIFAAKGRPPDNPLIVHLASADALPTVAAAITPLARRLAARFWPGPLTLVLDAAPELPSETTGGLTTVAVRVPDHAVAHAVLAAAGVAVAAPSANRSGRPSPTTAEHVAADLGDRVDLLVDAGPTGVGVESTVVDARGTRPVVFRDGAVTRELLGDACSDVSPAAPSPGSRYRHYAPTCPVEVVAADALAARATALARRGLLPGVVTPHGQRVPDAVEIARFSDVEELARELYGALRRAETAGVDVLLCSAVPEVGVGRAVMDRLRRAATAADVTSTDPTHADEPHARPTTG